VKPVLVVGVLAALLAGCGEEPPPLPPTLVEQPPVVPESAPDVEPGTEPGSGLIPEAGGLPSTLRVEIDGARIPALRVEEALRSEWAAHLASAPAAAGANDLLADFFTAPRNRCAQLLREIAVEKEAARLFDKLVPADVDALEARLRAAGQLLWFEQVAGDAAARAYVERVHRRALFEAMYTEASEEVSGEEVFAVYEAEVLEGLPDAAEREGVDVSFEKHGPLIRARLQRVRGLVDMNAWAAKVAAAMKLQIVLPDGSRLE
jgi:hypothetical protein